MFSRNPTISFAFYGNFFYNFLQKKFEVKKVQIVSQNIISWKFWIGK